MKINGYYSVAFAMIIILFFCYSCSSQGHKGDDKGTISIEEKESIEEQDVSSIEEVYDADTVMVDTVMVDASDVVESSSDFKESAVIGTNGILRIRKTATQGSSMSPTSYWGTYESEDKTTMQFTCYPYSKFGKKDFAELTECFNLSKSLSNVTVKIPAIVEMEGKQYNVERVRIINRERRGYPTAGRLILPSTIEMIKIWGWTELKEVVLSEGITEISERAFRGCPDLESVILPNTLNKIGKLAFDNCSGLVKIHIPNSVIDVCDGGAFVGLNKGITIEVENGCEALKGLEPTKVEIRGSYGYEHYNFNPEDIDIVYVE